MDSNLEWLRLPDLKLRWTCKCCGKQYNTLPLAYALDEPDPWRALPDEERMSRGVLSTDGCVVDKKIFCVRARMEIPVVGFENSFVWGIWVLVSEHDFERIGALWNDGLRRFGGPFLAGAAFTAVEAFFAPIAYRVQTYGLALEPRAAEYGRRLLGLESMQAWYAAALEEKFRDEPHEAEIRQMGTVLEDLRAH